MQSKLSAEITVLTTDELLERIIGSLPTNKLYTAERFCRKWQAIVKSDHFQQALFIKPVAPVLAYCFRNSKNPLQGSWSTSDTKPIPNRVFVDPFIKKRPELFSNDPPRPAHKRGAPKQMKIGFPPGIKGRIMPRKMKGMLFTQPPLAWVCFARSQGSIRYPRGSQIA